MHLLCSLRILNRQVTRKTLKVRTLRRKTGQLQSKMKSLERVHRYIQERRRLGTGKQFLNTKLESGFPKFPRFQGDRGCVRLAK